MAQGLTSISILRFASEIDAVGGARFDDGAGGDNEVQRTMLGELGDVDLDDRSSFTKQQELISFDRFLIHTELIVQLDGFDSRGAIKVLMATNR
jgi:26S proteasome regulatory subunit T1